MASSPHIREMTASDWPGVARVYREGIATGHATFETAVPEWSAWDRARHQHSRLVAVIDDVANEGPDPRPPDGIVGFAALSPTSTRAVYAGVAEIMIYVSATWHGRGVGSALMDRLIASSEAAGIWTLQAGIFPENRASLALHRRAGFRVLGTQERIGRIGDRWRDVVLLERRAR